MKYTNEFLEELSTRLHELAEDAASETDSDGTNDQMLTAEVGGEYFEFVVDVIVENYKYEEDTNTVDYKAKVYCKTVPYHENEKVAEYLRIEFQNEVIYSN